MSTLLVAIAGAAGAVLRYRIGVAVGVAAFPWPTLAVNLTGSFLLAAVLASPATRWSPTATTSVTVGLLGAYTTFSTFGYETFMLLRTGRVSAAVLYAALSVLGGVAAAAVGYATSRALSWP